MKPSREADLISEKQAEGHQFSSDLLQDWEPSSRKKPPDISQFNSRHAKNEVFQMPKLEAITYFKRQIKVMSMLSSPLFPRMLLSSESPWEGRKAVGNKSALSNVSRYQWAIQ